MTIYKTSELTGALLDAAVAKAEGLDPDVVRGGFSPSSRWHDAGPLIERERISVDTWQGGWAAQFDYPVRHPTDEKRNPSHHRHRGPTALVAAMRARVAAKFGEEVELPWPLD